MGRSFQLWIGFDSRCGPERNFTRLKPARVRLLVKRGEDLHPICSLLLPRNDLSFAIIPYASSGTYYHGQDDLRVGEVEKVVNLKSEDSFASSPKLQFHESGKVHVSAGNSRVDKVEIPQLHSWQGEHIATVDIDDLSFLPAPKAGGKKNAEVLDQPFELPTQWRAARLVVFVNGEEPVFSGSCPLVFAARCRKSGRRLFIGIEFKEHQPRALAGARGGIIVIGGWDPGDRHAETTLVALRGV